MSDAEADQGELAGMTDLAEAMAGPERGATVERVLGHLDGLRRRVQDVVDSGLPPEAFTNYSSVLKALDAATGVVLLRRDRPSGDAA